jgi:hypothetical protein
MEFFNSLQQVNANAKYYPAWQQQEAIKEGVQRQALMQHPPTKAEKQQAVEEARMLVDNINTMDTYAVNKEEDVLMVTTPAAGLVTGIAEAAVLGAIGLFLAVTPWGNKLGGWTGKQLIKGLERLPIVAKNPEWVTSLQSANPEAQAMFGKTALGLVAAFATAVGIEVADVIITRGLEKEAARVARFQAREIALNNPRNFVLYTPKQLAKAQQLAENEPEPPEEKPKKTLNPITLFTDSVKVTAEVAKDHQAYQDWKKAFHQAEETALKETDATEATPEQQQQAKADQWRLTRIIKAVELKSQQYLADAEMSVTVASLALAGLGEFAAAGLVGVVTLAQNMKWLTLSEKATNRLEFAKGGLVVLAPLLLPLAIAPYGVKIMKEGAKLGRFKAKQEILKHPEALIYCNETDTVRANRNEYTQKQQKQPTVIDWLKDQYKFFKNLKGDFDEYEQYEKTVEPQEYQLKKALAKIAITPQQEAASKVLQHRAFYAFETMDEKTQRYSDDAGGAVDIVKTVASEALAMAIDVAEIATIPAVLAMTAEKNQQKAEKLAQQAEGIQFQNKILQYGFAGLGLEALLTVPIVAINIVGTEFKKRASQVGVMMSMKELEDPKRMLIAPQLPLVNNQRKHETEEDAA